MILERLLSLRSSDPQQHLYNNLQPLPSFHSATRASRGRACALCQERSPPGVLFFHTPAELTPPGLCSCDLPSSLCLSLGHWPLLTSEGFFSFCRGQPDLVLLGSLEHLEADVV